MSPQHQLPDRSRSAVLNILEPKSGSKPEKRLVNDMSRSRRAFMFFEYRESIRYSKWYTASYYAPLLKAWLYMIRKSLFLGLTFVLIVALIALIVRGYKMDKEQAGRPSEKVEQAKPTPTRVLTPRDLEIVGMKMVLPRDEDVKKSAFEAHHEIEIHNNGTVPFKDIQLRFVYFDRREKALTSRFYSIAQSIPPGTALKLNDITINDIPAPAVNSKAAIICADIASAPATAQ
jgi:hypothetical protein